MEAGLGFSSIINGLLAKLWVLAREASFSVLEKDDLAVVDLAVAADFFYQAGGSCFFPREKLDRKNQ